MFFFSRQEKIVLLIITVLLLGTFGWNIYKTESSNITIIPSSEEINSKAEETTEDEVCIIHIIGAVHQPGVYQLSKDKRIIDAVKLAGGEKEKANLDAVNLAAHIYDGQKIIIPFLDDKKEISLSINSEATGTIQENAPSSNKVLLNINNANSNQLETLPGIGPVLADRILEYRRNNGMFRNIEEIMNVTGIGEKRFESIKEFIAVY
ncbi:MAG: helix-hairpin-helix domain-containing protein [Atribacterota bacterium]